VADRSKLILALDCIIDNCSSDQIIRLRIFVAVVVRPACRVPN